MSVNKIRIFIRKDCHFSGLGRLLKIDSACPINLLDRLFSATKTTDSRSLLRLMESYFDSNLCTLSRGVFPTVKYSGSLPISTTNTILKEIAKGIGKEICALIDITKPEIRNQNAPEFTNDLVLIAVPALKHVHSKPES
jgi:hypothetical protein